MILLIWDYNDKVYTKMYTTDDIMSKKELKVNGRKANKVILPKKEITPNMSKKLKRICAYNVVIVPIKDK